MTSHALLWARNACYLTTKSVILVWFTLKSCNPGSQFLITVMFSEVEVYSQVSTALYQNSANHRLAYSGGPQCLNCGRVCGWKTLLLVMSSSQTSSLVVIVQLDAWHFSETMLFRPHCWETRTVALCQDISPGLRAETYHLRCLLLGMLRCLTWWAVAYQYTLKAVLITLL